MKTINKVILVWNTTNDPVIKNTENWNKLALFSIATNRQYKTTTGEDKQESEFHSCVAWWWLAWIIGQYLTKWKLVYVEWRLRTRIIEKEDWDKIYKTEIVVSDLVFLDKKSDYTSTDSYGTDDLI